MKDPKVVNELASTVTKIDITTGKETSEPMRWTVMPPPPGKCKVCAQAHTPEEPHNANSMYYQICFTNQIGRDPTWADAMAHCTAEMQNKWKAMLVRRGVWSEPPRGEGPVTHHGVG